MIPYGRQNITDDDVAAVVEVLRSDFLTQGPVVPKFEETVAKYVGAKYASAVNSATSALHIACLALDVGEGDVVWTSPITFVATSNAARYCGASVDFVDIEPDTFNMSVKQLKTKLVEAKKLGKLPKVVIPVHMCGQPCDMEGIFALSEEYGFSIIEDASHAIGSVYKGQKTGSCEYSDITVFSFHPVKIITTGEGGLALTNNKNLIDKMNLFRSHGVTRDESLMKNQPDGGWYYEQVCLGFNYRMTDVQAALGISQMTRIEAFIKKRNEIAGKYKELLDGLPLVLPHVNSDRVSSYHLYVVRLDLSKTGKSHSQVFSELREEGLGVNLHYIPVYRQPDYARFNFPENYCAEAEKYYATAISLPMFADLSDEQLQEIKSSISKVLG